MTEPDDLHWSRRIRAAFAGGRPEIGQPAHLDLSEEDLAELMVEPSFVATWAEHLTTCAACAALFERTLPPCPEEVIASCVLAPQLGPPPRSPIARSQAEPTPGRPSASRWERWLVALGRLLRPAAAAALLGVAVLAWTLFLQSHEPTSHADPKPAAVALAEHSLEIRNANGTIVQTIPLDEKASQWRLGPRRLVDLDHDGLLECALALDLTEGERQSELRLYRESPRTGQLEPAWVHDLSLSPGQAPSLAGQAVTDTFGSQYLWPLELDGDMASRELLLLGRYDPGCVSRARGFNLRGEPVVDLWNVGELRAALVVKDGARRLLLLGGVDQGTSQALLGILELGGRLAQPALARRAPGGQTIGGLGAAATGSWIRLPRTRLGTATALRSYVTEIRYAAVNAQLVLTVEDSDLDNKPRHLNWHFDLAAGSLSVTAADSYLLAYLETCARGLLDCGPGSAPDSLADELEALPRRVTVQDSDAPPVPLDPPRPW